MEIDSRVYEEISWLRNDDFGSLAGAAAAELEALLDPAAAPRSQLLEHSAWLTSVELSKPLPPPAEGDTQLRGAALHRALFGEIYPYLNLPDNMRAPVSRVLDVSYVPHAFRPVQAHPAFGDVATTMQFIAFLLSIVDDVAAGRPLRQLELDDAGTMFDDAVAQRERVINLLDRADGIVTHLLALIAVVDDLEGVQTWPDVPDITPEEHTPARKWSVTCSSMFTIG